MKTAVILILTATQLIAADTISDALQKGLFEEEANHNLDAAIKAYQSVIDQTAEHRKFAATAVFRLGECYRKLNKTNEAVAQYQRVLREFPEQTPLNELSQKHLSSLQGSQQTAKAAGRRPDFEAEELERLKTEMKENDVVNARDQQRATPLHKAASAGHAKVALFLLANGADVNAREQAGATPLLLAVNSGHKMMVELLLTNGADPNVVGTYRSVFLDGQPFEGPPLTLAIYQGRTAIAETLLAHGANVNGKGSKVNYGQNLTALHLAAEKGALESTRLLISKGADVDARDNLGRTPLLVAVINGLERAVRLLLEHGADVNAQDLDGRSILHLAVRQASGVLGAILDKKPKLALQDKGGYTPLFYALSANNLTAAEMLLKAGANPNGHSSKDGTSLLFYAVHRLKSKEAVKLLLDYKADPNKPTPEGVTPLMYAEYPRKTAKILSGGEKVPNLTTTDEKALAEIAELLRTRGANSEAASLK